MAAARRPSWVWIVFAAVIAAMVITAGTFVTLRLTAPLPGAAVSILAPAPAQLDRNGSRSIPTPGSGSFALATDLGGTVAARGASVVRPIGSVAKAMTALVVLAARPLPTGESGPSITMSAEDVALYRQALAQGGSNLPVRAGEIFSERDLLLGLLLPSADNIAESLALWVSGNRSTFIARLNASAASFGMHHTRFADPSGLSTGTVSTASDLVVLARKVTANPALSDLVSTQKATLSNGVTLHNLDILLGRPGWLGIKTGWTGVAGGCLLFAAEMSYHSGQTVIVWGAALGQPRSASADPAHPELGEAFASAQAATTAAFNRYEAVDLSRLTPSVSGTISTKWGDGTSVVVDESVTGWLFVSTGAVLTFRATADTPTAPFKSGTTVGTVTGLLNTRTVVTWKVVSAGEVAAPSPWWKLFSG
jgi:D-alanyl-D-alanine carboxypeptidase (penicillin-binding protein 5/6)